jgi:hypothetical protein
VAADRKVYSARCDLHVTLAMDWPACPIPELSVQKRQAVFRGIDLDLADHIAEQFKIGNLKADGKRHGRHSNYVCHSIRRNVFWVGKREPLPAGMSDQAWEF